MKKITPFLWFDTQAEEAMNFYVSVFKNSKVLGVTPGPNGIASSVNFELEGQEFIALNAGPQFKFNESISFLVDCKTQEEVDELWAKLTADGGEEKIASHVEITRNEHTQISVELESPVFHPDGNMARNEEIGSD